MERDKVILKDFGKITTDRQNRDETLRAYICAILDVPAIEFDDVIKDINTDKEKESFIDMVCNDIKGRINRFFEEQKSN